MHLALPLHIWKRPLVTKKVTLLSTMERHIIIMELLHIICTMVDIFIHIVIITCKDFIDIRGHCHHEKVTGTPLNPVTTEKCRDRQRNHAGTHQQEVHVHQEALNDDNLLQSKTSFEELYILQGFGQKLNPFLTF